MQLPDPGQVAGDDPATCDALSAYLQAQSSLIPSNPFPSNARVTGFSSAGDGNMNRTLRLNLARAALPTVIAKQSLPYVAKYPDIPAPIERDVAEANFFTALGASPTLNAACPTLLAHDPSQHLLLLEDLGTGSDWTSIYAKPFDSAAATLGLTQLLSWLSQLHSAPVPPSYPTNMAMRQLNHEHLFVIPLQTDNNCAEFDEVAQQQVNLSHNPQVQNVLAELGKAYLGEPNELPLAEVTSCLLHGDFYPGSWLHGEGDQPYVIDPEFTFVGPAEYDLGIFAAHLYFAGVAEAELTELLKNYVQPEGFSGELTQQFMAMEIIRRLLGVAKLPLTADAATQLNWLSQAESWLLNPTPNFI